MTIAVVISTKGRPAELARCLRTLAEQTRKPDELLVIDADSDPRVVRVTEEARASLPRIRYHALPSSLTQARNFGIDRSTADAVVFLDDDLMLEPEFLAELVRPLERDSARRLGGVTGDIRNHPRGGKPLLQALKRLFLLPCDGDGRFRASGAPTTVHGLGEEREVEFLPGGLTAWRREVFAGLRFDESLPGLGINEDVDFSYRASRRWVNYYAPAAKCTHMRPSLKRERSPEYLRRELSSAWHLYRKNLPKTPLTLAAVLWHQVGVVVRFLFRRLVR